MWVGFGKDPSLLLRPTQWVQFVYAGTPGPKVRAQKQVLIRFGVAVVVGGYFVVAYVGAWFPGDVGYGGVEGVFGALEGALGFKNLDGHFKGGCGGFIGFRRRRRSRTGAGGNCWIQCWRVIVIWLVDYSIR